MTRLEALKDRLINHPVYVQTTDIVLQYKLEDIKDHAMKKAIGVEQHFTDDIQKDELITLIAEDTEKEFENLQKGNP